MRLFLLNIGWICKLSTNRKRLNVTLNEADKLILEKLAMERGISMSELVGYYIQIDNDADIYKADWRPRLKTAHLERDVKPEFEGNCTRLSFDGSYHICMMDQGDGAPPKIRKLTKSDIACRDICNKCPIDTRKADLRKGVMVQLRDPRGIRTNLIETAPTEFFIPACLADAELMEDGQHFLGCDLKRDEMDFQTDEEYDAYEDEPVNIETYCKVIEDGEQCGSLYGKLVGILWGTTVGWDEKSKISYPEIYRMLMSERKAKYG